MRRERLILEHVAQVQWIARRMKPDAVSLDDVVSAGMIGLIGAVDNFEVQQGAQLRTYAEHKIRGAILDSLRKLDCWPRGLRRMARRIESAKAAVERRVERGALEEEVAEELGVKLAEYHEQRLAAAGRQPESLEASGLQRLAEAVEERGADEEYERAELGRILRRGIEELPERERKIVSLYYDEGRTNRQIGAEMGESVHNVARVKAQAIRRLRLSMGSCWPRRGDEVGGGPVCREISQVT
jgi:RNA polymerase sigma factor for flagellar operon FliA